jgi:hypothetical protein
MESPKSEIVDGELHVEGVDHTFLQGMASTFKPIVTDLKCVAGYSSILSSEMSGGHPLQQRG